MVECNKKHTKYFVFISGKLFNCGWNQSKAEENETPMDLMNFNCPAKESKLNIIYGQQIYGLFPHKIKGKLK